MTNLQENDKKMTNTMTNLQVAKMALSQEVIIFCHLSFMFVIFPDLPFFYKQNDRRKLKLQYIFFFQALAGQESSKARLMGNAPPRAQLRDADQNQDGMLSLAEFREAWKKKA